MKELPFLTHDLGARNDPKLLEVEMDMRGQGKAIWWDLVEMLWENEGYLPMNFDKLAYCLRYATPDEVRHLVMDFDLFQNDGERFWNRSALDRITHKKDVVEARREGGRRGSANRWNNSPNGLPNNTPNNSPNGSASSSPMPINKLTNKEINKDNNYAPTALDIEEIFFFKNFINPSGEVSRFLKYYEERNWTYQDGTPVESWEQAARDWKPAKAGTRFHQEALNWYKAVWNAAKVHIEDASMIFIVGIDKLDLSGQKLTIRYKTLNQAQLASQFIQENDLAGDYTIDFRISN